MKTFTGTWTQLMAWIERGLIEEEMEKRMEQEAVAYENEREEGAEEGPIPAND